MSLCPENTVFPGIIAPPCLQPDGPTSFPFFRLPPQPAPSPLYTVTALHWEHLYIGSISTQAEIDAPSQIQPHQTEHSRQLRFQIRLHAQIVIPLGQMPVPRHTFAHLVHPSQVPIRHGAHLGVGGGLVVVGRAGIARFVGSSYARVCYYQPRDFTIPRDAVKMSSKRQAQVWA